MRGDEIQPAAGGDAAEVRRGPRHAAPRKSLLTKIQGPAGKAMALAAMPTAVFVGLGLTPKLALADEKDIPFAPGPCVTRSDAPVEPEESKSPEKKEESAKPTAEPSPSASAGQGDGDKDERPTPSASPSASPSSSPPATAPQAGTPDKAPRATPTPTKTVNPLDPLGVGDKIKDLFDGPDKPSPTPTPTATTASPTAKPKPKPSVTPTVPVPSAKPPTAPSAGPVDRTKEAIKEAAEKAGAKVEELPESAKGLDPKKDEDIPEGAQGEKPRFPCPTPDPEALANAKLEPGIPLLPDEPWRLESTRLTLKGLDYHGIVEVKTGSGKIKKVLKFTADEVDIKDLHQLTVHSEGLTGHVRSDRGRTSTITGGTVTMYTEELKGNLFGIIPITFSPESPPPLNVPHAMFTNVKVKQAGQFGGTLKVPGLRNTIERG
ncbi:hypothetical protein [Streptomyces purpureus]|uniref:Hydrogenase expression protein HypF n=1 Tax=Streptomyces purpureus TaxID=1951 RepID=A0A918H4K9_9ACTN|nr:hypothetical protein [Streptomyces purpureus]GGT33728.1 hypothetical protein GCM10014713_29310 [Streptomyces purpureus]